MPRDDDDDDDYVSSNPFELRSDGGRYKQNLEQEWAEKAEQRRRDQERQEAAADEDNQWRLRNPGRDRDDDRGR